MLQRLCDIKKASTNRWYETNIFFLIFSSKKKKQPNCFFCIFYDDILHHTPTKNSVPKCQPETSSKLHTQSKTDETKTEEKEWPVIDVFKEHNGPFKYYIIIRTGGQDITLWLRGTGGSKIWTSVNHIGKDLLTLNSIHWTCQKLERSEIEIKTTLAWS